MLTLRLSPRRPAELALRGARGGVPMGLRGSHQGQWASHQGQWSSHQGAMGFTPGSVGFTSGGSGVHTRQWGSHQGPGLRAGSRVPSSGLLALRAAAAEGNTVGRAWPSFPGSYRLTFTSQESVQAMSEKWLWLGSVLVLPSLVLGGSFLSH